MRVVIDTSSLLSLVRYYLPFDKNNVLYAFIETKVKLGEIIILDKVVEECKFIAKGIVIEKLQYLSNKKFQVKTDELLPTQRFFNQLENQFINGSIRNKLTPIEFENRKDSFLNSADSKLILYSLKNKNDILSKLFIVTEETEFSNDNKAFKKLPAICKILEIDVLTLPKLLELYEGIDLAIINQ
jgi:hypothetical protein